MFVIVCKIVSLKSKKPDSFDCSLESGLKINTTLSINKPVVHYDLGL